VYRYSKERLAEKKKTKGKEARRQESDDEDDEVGLCRLNQVDP
jgi:hypothetical protein